MITEDDIKKLDELQAKECQGRGICCVQTVLMYLRLGNEVSAQSVRRTEGDKTRSYPEVEKQLYKMFGCRTHGKQGCDDWLCQALEPKD
jgi:hypothetical protein